MINFTKTYYDAVWCPDLYAENIEAERNGTVSSDYFTKVFDYDREDERPRICPNITETVALPLDDQLIAQVVPCDEAVGDYAKYAANFTCGDPGVLSYSFSFFVSSTNFDPDIYEKDHELQIYPSVWENSNIGPRSRTKYF